MSCSISFSLFPSEIRLQVWKEALTNESDSRLIVTYFPDAPDPGTHILPHTGLVSPLLSVSVESRQCALAFYPLRLPICPLYKTLSLQLAKSGQGSSNGGRGRRRSPLYPSHEALVSCIQSRRVGVALMAFQGLDRECTSLAKASGGAAMYVNPQRDTFVSPSRSFIQLYGTKYYKTLYTADDEHGDSDEEARAGEVDSLLTPAFPEPEYVERVASQVARVLLVGGEGFGHSEPWMEPGHLHSPRELKRFPNASEVRYILVKDPVDVLKRILRTGLYRQPGVLQDPHLSAWLPADDVRRGKVELPYPF